MKQANQSELIFLNEELATYFHVVVTVASRYNENLKYIQIPFKANSIVFKWSYVFASDFIIEINRFGKAQFAIYNFGTFICLCKFSSIHLTKS